MERRVTTVIAAAAAATLAVATAASAQLPAPLPEAQAPQVEAPQVQAPSAPQPQAAPVQASGVELPSAPQPPNTLSAPRLRSAPSLPSAQPAGAPSAGSTSSSGSAQSGGGNAPSSSPSAAGQSSSPSARASSSGKASAARRQPPAARREAVLRRTVRRLQGCLPALGNFERRVLELRSGISGPALSVGAVARRLEVSAARVRAAEGSGLSHLRRADSRLGCGAQPGGDARGSRAANRALGLAVTSVPALVRASDLLPESAQATGRKKRGSGRPDEQGIAGVQGSSSPKDDGLKLDRGAPHAAASGSDFPLRLGVIIAVLLLLLPIAALATLRRRRPAAAGGEAAAEPAGTGAEQQPAPASRTSPAEPTAATSTRQEPPAPVPTPPPAARQQEGQRTAADRTQTVTRGSRRVGSALGAGAASLLVGFRDLGRDVVRRARSHRGRR